MMYDLFLYGLKVSACTAVLYIFFKLLLSKETFHRVNRVLLLIGLVASYLLPLFVVTVTEQINIVPTTEVNVIEGSASEISNETLVNDLIIKNILGILYVAGILAMLIRLTLSIRKIKKIVNSGRRTSLADGSVLVTVDDNIGAFSWLKYIVISKFEEDDTRRMIMLHEQGHIKMHHTYDLLVTDILGAFQWFNPFIWMLRAELKNLHEFEADSYVLSKGENARDYQLLLIKKAVGASRYSVANSFDHNKLKIRITMMLNEKSSKLARAKALLMLPLLCIGVMAFAETKYVYAADKGSEKSIETVKNDSLKVLYLVDGVKTESVDKLSAAEIASATVLKGADAAVYGDYDQVVEITTRKNEKDIIVNGVVKDADGKVIAGAKAEIMSGDDKTVTDRNGRFKLLAKNTDVVSVSYADYRTVNMKAGENMTFVLKNKGLKGSIDDLSLDSAVVVLKVSEPKTKEQADEASLTDAGTLIYGLLSPNDDKSKHSSTSTSTSTSTSDDKSKAISTSRSETVNKDGSKNVTSSVSYSGKDKAIVIKDENNKPILVTRNGKKLEDPDIYVDGKKVESLNDLNLKSDKILSISVEPDNKILITLKKDGVKYPTQKEIVKAQKHLNGKGNKYYVTTHDGKTDVIRAKNESEAIKYCQTHYNENVLLLKRPNGGVIKVVKPINK